MAFLAANPTATPATRASAATSAVVIASSSSETKNRAGGLFGHLLGDGYGERDERLPTRACSLPHSYLREPLVKTLRKRCRVPNWCLSESASQIHNLRPRGPSCNTPGPERARRQGSCSPASPGMTSRNAALQASRA